MEPEKGQPCLYTVRETTTGELLASAFLKEASAEMLYALVHEIETKYKLVISGMISDKQRSIISMHDKYYPDVPIQFCTIHYMKNVTAELRGKDKTMQKNLRSEIRNLSVLKTIVNKTHGETTDLDEKELKVLSETRVAVLAVANRKKKEMFDLAGIKLYNNISEMLESLQDLMEKDIFHRSSSKFQLLIKHLTEKIAEILGHYAETYNNISIANFYIHPMFKAVMEPHSKHPKRAFYNIVKEWKSVIQDDSLPKVVKGLLEQALKFALSYERGLFVWRQAKLPHHNNSTEAFYNEKKGNYRQYSRNKKIGITLQLSRLEEMYIPKNLTMDEIETDLDLIGSEAYWEIRKDVDSRKESRRFCRLCRKDIKGVLSKIFKQLEEK